jgi:hypothetical protein
LFDGISSGFPDGDRTGRPSNRIRVVPSAEEGLRVTDFQNLGIPRGILGTSATVDSLAAGATLDNNLRSIFCNLSFFFDQHQSKWRNDGNIESLSGSPSGAESHVRNRLSPVVP